MMMSGVNVRSYGSQDPEQADSLARVWEALPELLSGQELQELADVLEGDTAAEEGLVIAATLRLFDRGAIFVG